MNTMNTKQKSIYPLLETIECRNGNLQCLDLHFARMQNSLQSLGIAEKPPAMPENICSCAKDLTKSYRISVVYGREVGEVRCIEYKPRTITSLRIVEAGNLEYSHKYADRSALDKLFEQRNGEDEVLLVRGDRVLETSLANIALYDPLGRRWETPRNPLLKGTRREVLMREKKIFPADIVLTQLSRYLKISLINAMLDLEEIVIDIENVKS